MHDAPSNAELITAVKSFLDDVAGPQLTGHAAFHARVASNALAIVLRDMEARPRAEAEEHARLRRLLNAPASATLSEMNTLLCQAIRSGQAGLGTPGLLAHLKSTTIDQLKVDQPNYSGLKTATQNPA